MNRDNQAQLKEFVELLTHSQKQTEKNMRDTFCSLCEEGYFRQAYQLLKIM